jgi:GAF domain-containing protein
MIISRTVAVDTERLRSELLSGGLNGAVKWLNARTSCRYTGIYHLDDATMRTVALFDRNGEDVKALTVIPLGDSFCQFVMKDGQFNATDIANDARLTDHAFRDIVASYFGLPLSSESGGFYGTLCHFDVVPNAIDDAEIAFLYSATPVLMAHISQM